MRAASVDLSAKPTSDPQFGMARADVAGANVGLDGARALLEKARLTPLTRPQRAALAEELAAALLTASRALTLPHERQAQALLARLVDDPRGQALTTALTDRAFRSRDLAHVTGQLQYLARRLGVPHYMPPWSRMQLWAGRLLGGAVPQLTGRAVLDRVRSEARRVLLPAEPEPLAAFLEQRKREGVRINVNQLGEALLGEKEAEARFQKYEQLAKSAPVAALSVKVSSMGSQLNLLAFEATSETLAQRLARIYRATLARAPAERPIVMLDMEAYNDVALTIDVMRRALDDVSLAQVRAGVVLQAYLPDSNALLREVLAMSEARVAQGGTALRVRLVKGANLAHERVESEKTGLPLPIYAHKYQVDANYKRLLETALPAVQRGSVELGVASHNLFDLAYALVLREQAKGSALGLQQQLGIEMLEGMANAVVRALSALQQDVLVYAPICEDDTINSGIAYLVRRLDENTAGDNFLRNSFAMQPGDAAFERERERFRKAVSHIDRVDERPLRELRAPRNVPAGFHGEPDSDFARAEVRTWIREKLREAADEGHEQLIGSCIAGTFVAGARRDAADPSRPNVVPYRVALAHAEDVERALACAVNDPTGFSRTTPEQRSTLLAKIAKRLREQRGELIATVLRDGGKRVQEADAEVSEAIDFAEYYRHSYERWRSEPYVTPHERGVVLVTPPWNFPLAIAAGGVFAALMAGNRVILKPPLETALIGAKLAALCWDAGVPREALQLVICEDEVASALVRDARVNSVILTGATDTARLFQRLRPGLHLMAETGGKNAYVVTAMSDRELAIRDVVHSAFGHAGQKCSACSLLILEREVYDDAHFMATLADAVRSLHVGSAWDARSFVTPLIQPPSGALLRALKELASGESWLVEPRISPDNPRLLSPGVKLGVSAGSFMHTTELFGPVLSVMRADSLAHAIELTNATGYALTSGLASLDEREQSLFIERVRAGNIYVNRTITGAIVGRQPFGGFGKSGFGPGAKAGGPNYVAQLCRFTARDEPSASDAALHGPIVTVLEHFSDLLPPYEAARLHRYACAYQESVVSHFRVLHDEARVLGQDNLFSYRAAEGVVVRVEHDAKPFDVAASCLAMLAAGAPIALSVSPHFHGFGAETRWSRTACVETIAQLGERAPNTNRVRLLGSRSAELDTLSAQLGFHIADNELLPSGRLELLHYLREQTVSRDYHRYGNLGERGLKSGPERT